MNRTARTLAQLRRYESPNVFYRDPAGSWPIVWDRAQGVYVWDVEGRKYLDLTAAFGVAAAGHGNRSVVRAGQKQMGHLLHAMGDVHPHALKAELAKELSHLTFERWHRAEPGSRRPNQARFHGKTIFCNSGFEAVESALKTACLATGRRGVIAFEGAYHGLGYGALNATHRPEFREPFASQLGQFGHFLAFPEQFPSFRSSVSKAGTQRRQRQSQATLEEIMTRAELLCRRHAIGAVLVEPVQGRGGIRVPAAGLLAGLRSLCDEHNILLIADEIYTGFGRVGRWFGCEQAAVVPDLVCLGKALTGGFPLSACVGSAEVMDRAWPLSQGEAIHTSTYLGHPVGCAMALAQIAAIRSQKLVPRSERLGGWLRAELAELALLRPDLQLEIRGLGLMIGLVWRAGSRPLPVMPVVKAMLGRGFLLLPEGARGEVLALTPPLIITERQLRSVVAALAETLADRELWS